MKKKHCGGKASNQHRSESQREDKRKKDHFVDYYACSVGYGRKKGKRIRTLNWIEGAEEPEPISEGPDSIEKMKEEQANAELEQEVEKALEKLDKAEEEFIRYFYFDCKSYEQISELMGKTKDRLERIHSAALEKLKFSLKGFVSERYKIKVPVDKKCVICSHPEKEKLEALIMAKKKEETWKNILGTFKESFDLEIKAPQILINHQKKHMADS